MRQTYKYKYLEMTGMPVKQEQYLGTRLLWYRTEYLAHESRKKFAENVERFSMKYGVRFTASDVANYETGRCCPKIDKLIALCEATGMPQYWWTGKELRPAELHLRNAA